MKDKLGGELNILETAECRSVIRNIVQHVDNVINKLHTEMLEADRSDQNYDLNDSNSEFDSEQTEKGIEIDFDENDY